MSLTKIIPLENLTSTLSGGDAEVLRDWTESLSRQQSILAENSGRGDLEFQIFREIEERLTRRCAELEAEVARSSRFRQESEAFEKIRILETSLRAAQSECAVLRRICDADKQLLALNEQEENEMRMRAETLENDLRIRAERENAAMIARTEEMEAMFRTRSEREDEIYRTRTEKMEEQSGRLRRYAETLNQEKEWIRTTATQMEDEIRNASMLHPLKDYLTLTENESVRVEIELKKMPMASPSRAGLEEMYGQLVTQREFLRTVMEASAKEVEARADRLAKIRMDGRSAPVPPHPTKKPISSKA